MPPPIPGDGILESELRDSGTYPSVEDEVMPMSENVAGLMEQQLTQTGIIAQNNFVGFQKLADYDYLENKRMVTLDEAVGVREVASKSVPAGPTSV